MPNFVIFCFLYRPETPTSNFKFQIMLYCLTGCAAHPLPELRIICALFNLNTEWYSPTKPYGRFAHVYAPQLPGGCYF
jgi:hypothetical protein